jgi:hypothetical protein
MWRFAASSKLSTIGPDSRRYCQLSNSQVKYRNSEKIRGGMANRSPLAKAVLPGVGPASVTADTE